MNFISVGESSLGKLQQTSSNGASHGEKKPQQRIFCQALSTCITVPWKEHPHCSKECWTLLSSVQSRGFHNYDKSGEVAPLATCAFCKGQHFTLQAVSMVADGALLLLGQRSSRGSLPQGGDNQEQDCSQHSSGSPTHTQADAFKSSYRNIGRSALPPALLKGYHTAIPGTFLTMRIASKAGEKQKYNRSRLVVEPSACSLHCSACIHRDNTAPKGDGNIRKWAVRNLKILLPHLIRKSEPFIL